MKLTILIQALIFWIKVWVIYEHADASIESLNMLTEKLQAYRDEFVKKYKLDEPEEVQS